MSAKYRVSLAVILVGLISGATISPAFSQIPQEAPKQIPEQKDMPRGYGFIPPTVDLSHLTGQTMPAKLSGVMAPAQWDWRAQGKVTSVKNQSTCGACYSFAALANFESKMLIDTAGTYDFSENNAKECNFHDRSCGGGNYYDMASFLSQKGTVLESCDPYVAANVSCNSSCTYQKTLLGWKIVSSGSVPSTTQLKNYIYANGPVYTTLYAGDGSEPSWSSEFNAYDGSYTMYHTTSQPVNHAVLIVGYDDTLSHGGGTGAWIVKNSWASSWGGTCGYGTEGGYFTIAYGSANIGMWSSYMYDWQNYDQNGEVLYHDEGGWMTQYGYSATTAWGMAKFVPSQDVNITRVEFWTNDITTDVDIYLYDDFNTSTLGLSNPLASKLDVNPVEAGYHSIVFDTPVEISSGNDVYAVVKIINTSYTAPIVADTGYAASQTTYMSSNGANGTWYDLGANVGDDVAIRIRSTYPLAQSIDDDDILLPHIYSLSTNYPNPFNPITTIDYSLQIRSHVSISVYNLIGQEILTLVNEAKPAGPHTTQWDGKNSKGKEMATGVYFYQIKAEDFTETRKMLLLK